MGKNEHSISFELGSGTDKFFPGALVEGVVTFNLHKGVSGVKSVYVVVEGHGHVQWTDTEKNQDDNENEKRKYTAKEKYIKNKVKLLDGDEISNKLEQGNHSYNFSFLMPKWIPATYDYLSCFENDFLIFWGGFSLYKGYVKYVLKAKIKREGDKSNIKDGIKLKCLGDAPLPPYYLTPLTKEKHKTLGILCCTQGTIIIQVSTEKSAYLPGENLIVNVHVDNGSSTEIEGSEYAIERKTILKAKCDGQADRKFLFKDFVEASGNGCQNDQDEQIFLKIPEDCVPSELPGCNIIKVFYELKVKMKVPGCHRSPVIRIPFTISSPVPQQPFVQQPDKQGFPQPIVTSQPVNNQQMVYPPAVQSGADFKQPFEPNELVT